MGLRYLSECVTTFTLAFLSFLQSFAQNSRGPDDRGRSLLAAARRRMTAFLASAAIGVATMLGILSVFLFAKSTKVLSALHSLFCRDRVICGSQRPDSGDQPFKKPCHPIPRIRWYAPVLCRDSVLRFHSPALILRSNLVSRELPQWRLPSSYRP